MNDNRPFTFVDPFDEGEQALGTETRLAEFEIGSNEDGTSGSEISLCVLSCINVGRIKKLSEIEQLAMHTVESLDFVIDNQAYPVKAAEKMLKRRSIGVGITNLATYLAKKKVSYEDKEALVYVDELAEHIQFYLIKASVQLAKERGPCEWFHKTKWAKGILPIDTYHKNVDNLVKRELTLDWEWLRAEILEHGMRNSVLSCQPPVESSSVVQNATNGIEPIRNLVSIKKSKSSIIKQVVESPKLPYTHAWEMYSNKGMINIAAVIQKYWCQAISLNTYINPGNIMKYDSPDDLELSEVVDDIMHAYTHGIKTMYYNNLNDGKTDEDDAGGCESGACSV